MAYTEFYCDAAAGANINAGDKTANGVVTSTNGAWSTVTNIFTATGGTPFSGVSAGDFASVYIDGATVAVYIARVTSVGGGGLTLTLSSTAKSGTAPTTSATGRSCTTGGAWLGPNGASAFPFSFIATTMMNASANPYRVNYKNGTNYAITATMTHNLVGPGVHQGYTATAGDGGKAVFDGGTSGASYNLLVISGLSIRSALEFRDLILQNNGATGNAHGFFTSDGGLLFVRCVFNSLRGNGWYADGNNAYGSALIECEAYACNQNNTANYGGFRSDTFDYFLRCIAHDNAGGNGNGFVFFGIIECEYCIADTNAGHGFYNATGARVVFRNCDAYNNTSSGFYLDVGLPTTTIIENCNAIKNGGYGINNNSGSTKVLFVSNCGFGSGTQANTSGATNFLAADAVTNENAVTYATDQTPWVDPANGDFRISLAAAKGAGRGAFTETAASYAGTVGYPDIGAAQHLESNPIGQVVKVASIGTY